MYNIQKTENGFQFEGNQFEFIEIDGNQYNIISDTQVHIYTDMGIILLDLNVAIEYRIYDNIVEFINELYG
jgi:hypothetical protein